VSAGDPRAKTVVVVGPDDRLRLVRTLSPLRYATRDALADEIEAARDAGEEPLFVLTSDPPKGEEDKLVFYSVATLGQALKTHALVHANGHPCRIRGPVSAKA
jgi:hypothetical protein